MRTIQIKRGTAANTPVLAEGELGLQTDAGRLYVGSGGENLGVAMGRELDAAKAELNQAIAGRAPASHTHTAQEVGARPVTWVPSKAEVGLGSVDNVSANDIRRGGGKHLAGQGTGGGYSFTGDSGEDTCMFSDADGELYFMKNGQRFNSQDFFTPDGSKSVNYANSANYANGAGNSDMVDGYHIVAQNADVSAGQSIGNVIVLVYE